MKKIILTTLIALFAMVNFAQTTDFINYQAVARDAAGTLIKNKTVALRFSVLLAVRFSNLTDYIFKLKNFHIVSNN